MTKLRPLAFTLTLIAVTSHAETANEEALNKEALQKVQQLGSGLKGALQSAMKSGGPIKAIEACNLQAPDITRAVSDNVWTVGRTSLKPRNTQNSPDTWETRILHDMKEKLEAGTPINTLSHSEVVEADGKKTFRFMKAIPTQAICLKCHGNKESFDAKLKEKIEALYPNDMATGFKEGDIRGAFTLTKTL